MVDRVLCGNDEERLRQHAGFAFDGDLAFFHDFEQGALRFRRRTVDFIGQQYIGEHRPRMKLEDRIVTVIDRYAEDVGRQQVAGELYTAELEAEHLCQGVGEGGLAHARQVLDQQMSACEYAGERHTDLPVLAEDDLIGGVDDVLCDVLHACSSSKVRSMAG